MSGSRVRRGAAREAILLATLKVIARDGVDGVTHRRVAELAGVSPGSTTHHFASKADLVRTSFFHYHVLGDQFLGDILDDVRSRTSDPGERVVDFLCQVVEREFAQTAMLRVEFEIFLSAARDAELATHIRSWEARWVGFIAGELEQAMVSRPVEAARTLGNLLRGFELERLVDPDLAATDFRRRVEVVIWPSGRQHARNP